MKVQPYRSHWLRRSMGPAGHRGAAKRYWKRRGHRLFRRLTKLALHTRRLDRMPWKVSVDDGT